jgi:hypothetical protein
VTHGPGQRPRPTRLRTPACEGPVFGSGRSATAHSMVGPRCPRTGRHRPGTDTGPPNKNGGSRTDSGDFADRRLHHRDLPVRRILNHIGAPAGRCRTGLEGPGATLTRVCLRPGSAVVPPCLCRRAPVMRPFLCPGRGKPPPAHARSLRGRTDPRPSPSPPSAPPRRLPHPFRRC